MKRRIAIYGGTDLTAAESWFVVSLTLALLSNADLVLVTGGFLYQPKLPGAISTDFSVLQGAKQHVQERGLKLEDCLETWLPDPDVENDPQKKNVTRFREGSVKDLKGDSAQARRFAMVRDVDALITIKGKRHTAVVLDFAITINKPALPLPFTGGDSREFWKTHKERVITWFNLQTDFADKLEIEKLESWTPANKKDVINTIILGLDKALEKESLNENYYKQVQKELEADVKPSEGIVESSLRRVPQNTDETTTKKQLKMFLSYAHEDVLLKDELDKHLTALKRSQRISIWQDKNIAGGSDWDETIKEELEQADIILLLISPDFVASEYIWNNELKKALLNHESGRSKIIPIFLRGVVTDGMPFEKLQGYIDIEKPIASFLGAERDNAFREVVKRISNDIDQMLK